MRIGLAGTGRIGAFHAKTLTTIDGVDDLVLADLDTALAERVASELRTAIMTDAEPHPEDLFAYVYATPTLQLREQAAQLAAEQAMTKEDAR